MSQQRNMIINFMDGTKVAYDFPKQIEDDMHAIKKIETILAQKFLIIEGDGTVHLYPVNNIKSIQMYPVATKLPDYAIRGAESVEIY